jgi:signal peptidase II
VAFAGAAADQAAKFYVFSRLADYPDRRAVIIPRVLDFACRMNTGTAFGLFAGRNWLFILLTFVAMAAVVAYVIAYTRRGERLAVAGAGVVVGGAIGNVMDRLAFSAVRDFIDFHFWPVFNVADVLICAGAGALALSTLIAPEAARAGSPARESEAELRPGNGKE